MSRLDLDVTKGGQSPVKTKSSRRRHVHMEFISGGGHGGHDAPQPGSGGDGVTGHVRVWVTAD